MGVGKTEGVAILCPDSKPGCAVPVRVDDDPEVTRDEAYQVYKYVRGRDYSKHPDFKFKFGKSNGHRELSYEELKKRAEQPMEIFELKCPYRSTDRFGHYPDFKPEVTPGEADRVVNIINEMTRRKYTVTNQCTIRFGPQNNNAVKTFKELLEKRKELKK